MLETKTYRTKSTGTLWYQFNDSPLYYCVSKSCAVWFRRHESYFAKHPDKVELVIGEKTISEDKKVRFSIGDIIKAEAFGL